MAKTMMLDVVDSEKQIFSGEVEYLVAPAFEGEIGIYPNHIALISKLKPGILRLQIPNQAYQLIYAISGGFVEINDNHTTVLADIVERTEELDEARLIEQKNQALKKIQAAENSNTDFTKAQAALEIAIAQLKAMEYIRNNKNKV
ncbi:MAG: F0F1 ATP synthase subunit epsilon [Burkholderiales bacterium]|jgi:F-type H+-transporting ATPase subunit epsilon|nr:F0F1 ATP synthase subunit epsilon [Burkholderiales bacterium]